MSVRLSLLRHAPSVACAALLALAVASPLSAQTRWPSINERQSPALARPHTALALPQECEFIETPLRDVIDFLRDVNKAPIMLRGTIANDAGARPITLHLKEVSLRTVLNTILGDLGLAYTVENEQIVITSQEEAARRPVLRTYDISTLLEGGETQHLVDLITRMTGPKTPAGVAPQFPADDVPAANRELATYGHLLIVRDTEAGQTRVAELLATLGHALGRDFPLPARQQQALSADKP